VPQSVLNGKNVNASIKQVGGEGPPEIVRGTLSNSSLGRTLFDDVINGLVGQSLITHHPMTADPSE
tara:strand:- start:5 stop:202 length:198 start_codon:yes stop_codon:yes gene_type:complete